MNKRYSDRTIKLILILFIVINVYAIVSYPFTSKKSSFIHFYNSFALPGPFFSEDRIMVVPRYAYRVKSKAGWTSWRDPERENFLQYHENPLLYAKLQQSNFERSLARQLSRKVNRSGADSIWNTKELRALHEYFENEYIKEDVDSAQLLYVVETYVGGPQRVTRDTTINLYYSADLL